MMMIKSKISVVDNFHKELQLVLRNLEIAMKHLPILTESILILMTQKLYQSLKLMFEY